mmetsp:Transcript_41549/g.81955  ORF Transcript_41549/g.81955 Transcript_41549/m.81955 type:complete len:134 (+) Transcript_41549:867-1268(+)
MHASRWRPSDYTGRHKTRRTGKNKKEDTPRHPPLPFHPPRKRTSVEGRKDMDSRALDEMEEESLQRSRNHTYAGRHGYTPPPGWHTYFHTNHSSFLPSLSYFTDRPPFHRRFRNPSSLGPESFISRSIHTLED